MKIPTYEVILKSWQFMHKVMNKKSAYYTNQIQSMLNWTLKNPTDEVTEFLTRANFMHKVMNKTSCSFELELANWKAAPRHYSKEKKFL